MARKRVVFGVSVVALVAAGACTLIGGSFEVDPSLDTSVSPGDGGGLVDGSVITADGSVDSGCGDLRIDRKNCGGCGVDCLEGQCLEGRCTPYTVATIDGGSFGDIALYGDDIWASYQQTGSGRLLRFTGGKTIDDVTDAGVIPGDLAVAQYQSGFVLYWTTSDGKRSEIRRCSLPECTDNTRVFIDTLEQVPELTGVDGDPEAVLSTGRSARLLNCSTLTSDCAVAGYDAGIVPGAFLAPVINRKPGFRAAFLAPAARRVVAIKELNQAPNLSDIATDQPGLNALALDGSHVVWVGVDDKLASSDKGYVRRCKDNSLPCQVEQIATDPFEPKTVKIVGEIVIWSATFPGQPLQGGAIRACNLATGCKEVVTVSNGEPGARDVNADDKAFVWSSSERIGTTNLHHVRRVVRPVSQRP